ncbi:MAG: protein kinase [Deltaproteobacteria bacterium]|nr:protein kinase [Deltaproteobacteria bacterium]MBP7285992.1 protein kinase [Nannocystaceae bacterium]
MNSDDPNEVPTAPERRLSALVDSLPPEGADEPPASWLEGLVDPGDDDDGDGDELAAEGDGDDDPAVETLAGDGIESRVLLARAQNRLLGWDRTPVQIGRYRILAPLGAGGMGMVYEAHDDELDRPVAIKILRRELAPGSSGRQRLLREAQATAKLSHPNVVHVYEVGQSGEQVFMAMELVRGVTLRQWRKQGALGWREIVQMYMRAAEGLIAAHEQGIVHRDFKPDNVLVSRDGRPQIVDFGLARAASDAITVTAEHPAVSASGSRLRDFDITRTGTVIGTPAYMAPEQLARAEPSAKSDQFSFCASLFEALYGKRPFGGSTYSELEQSLTDGRPVQVDDRSSVPRAIHAAVMRGLAREPVDRHASMRALIDALHEAQRPRTRTWAALVAACALGLGGGAWWLGRTDGDAVAAASREPTAAAPRADAPSDAWAEIVAATPLPAVVGEPDDDDPSGVSVHRLRNGLTIYVAHRPQEPAVAAALVVRAGPMQESRSGISGLVATAIRRGTARIGVLDHAAETPLLVFQHRMIEALPRIDDDAARGVLLQHIAAAEQATAPLQLQEEVYAAVLALGARDPLSMGGFGTTFATEVPRHRLEAWMQITAESVRRPVFRQFLSATVERLQLLGWFPARSDDALRRELAKATGTLDSIDTQIATLTTVPLADAREFHDRYYRPNNTALVLVGDITADEADAMAEHVFGDWEPAAIPAIEAIDEPLPERVQLDAPDISRGVEVTWPMPPVGSEAFARFDTLPKVLSGRSGLLGAQLKGKAAGWGAYTGHHRDFSVFLMPNPGQANAELEGIGLAALRRIADDQVDDATWSTALTEAAFERLSWARGPGSLALAIVESFATFRPWTHGPAAVLRPPPTRAEAIATAKELLTRTPVVTYSELGRPAHPQVPSLPSARPELSPGRRSAWVHAILDAPSTPMEPRFIVEGSHYHVHAHGAGRVITTTAPGPLFRMSWIYPVGTAENPWACDALRPRLREVPIAGVELMVFCSTTDTRYEIIGEAARFDEIMPPLVTWLTRPQLDADDAREFADHTVRMRAEDRAIPDLAIGATEMWALLGEHALDPSMPSDEDMRRHGGTALRSAEAEIVTYDPDVLYVGPAPERLLALLPAPRGRTSGAPFVRAYRSPERQEILLVDLPDADRFTVRVAVPWFADAPREHLAAMLHRDAVHEASFEAALPIAAMHSGYNTQYAPGPPLAIGVGFESDADAVASTVDRALEVLRARPNAGGFEAARRRLEVAFRAHRTAPAKVPGLVYPWPAGGTDPRVEQWLALPSLSWDDVQAYYARLDTTVPIVLVAGDLARLDRDALARRGAIVQVDLRRMVRDGGMSGLGLDTPALMDE